ncbi:MAG: hypothetical protein AMXMBFR82_03490 [Candidatus Hydrogenedentota bacterium]
MAAARYGFVLLALVVLCTCFNGIANAAAGKAVPKEGKTVDPPLSEVSSDEVKSMPVLGAIEWQTTELPWVEQGPDAGISGVGMAAFEVPEHTAVEINVELLPAVRNLVAKHGGKH